MKRIALTPPVPTMEFAFMGNVIATQDGAAPTARYSSPCALTSVLAMGLIFRSLARAPVIPTGLAQIAQLKSVLWTVVHMAFAWVARVDVKKVGLVLLAIREPVTLAVQSMAPAKMANVNAIRAGTESTVLLRGVQACATAMAGVPWIKMVGTVFVNQGGVEQAVMSPWKHSALMARTMKEMD